MVAFSVGFLVEDKDCLVSVLGHVQDVALWLSSPLALPPRDREALRRWADEVRDYLTYSFPCADNRPAIFETLMQTGILTIRRQPVKEVERVSYADGGLMVGLSPSVEPSLRRSLED